MQRIARLALFVERYALSTLFLWFAWKQVAAIESAFAAWRGGQHAAFPGLVNHLLIFTLQLVTGCALLFSKAPERIPGNWKELVIPLVGTFFYIGYNFAGDLPAPLSHSLAPPDLQAPLAAAALLLSCAGFAIAVWGAAYLGRSFAVFVAVREIVREGPYRFVRHPIYSGYVLHLVSLFLSRTSPAMAVLVTAHLALTVWRARLEEASLQAHSEAYRRYAQRTGFLLPRRLF
jgi:protein-S-isoprenylcysteine O-methyltransferase Ste14